MFHFKWKYDSICFTRVPDEILAIIFVFPLNFNVFGFYQSLK